MQYGTVSFPTRFESGTKSAVYDAVGEHQPRLHPVTLQFEERALEVDYLEAMRIATTTLMRFGILLALCTYLLLGALDLRVAAGPAAITLRAVVLVLAALLIVASFQPPFARHRETLVALFCVTLGAGLTAILAAAPAVIVSQYYAGYIVMVIGTYTVFGLGFLRASIVSALLIGMYVSMELFFHGHADARVLGNGAFLLATAAISAVGGYIAERQRRLAHFRLRVIERDRAHSLHCALHDPLTGLPNRRLLMERLQRAVTRDRRFNTFAAVLFVDLDEFKVINDRHGHLIGDRLLKRAADTLLDCVRDTDTVARMGGDEFVVLLEDLTDAKQIDQLVARILARFAEPCVADGLSVMMPVSIGAALHPQDGDTPRTLLDAADKAMYLMKHQSFA